MRRVAGNMSARGWLLAVALAGGMAALLVSALAGWIAWREQIVRLDSSLIATSRAITASVDRELDQAVALARGLSVSGALANGEIDRFDRQARDALAPYGYELVVEAADVRRQVVNTRARIGAGPDFALEPSNPAPGVRDVVVTALRRSDISGQWATAIELPVAQAGSDLNYLVSILIPSTAFQKILSEQRLPAEWSPVILDADWTIVARDLSPEKYIGRKGAAQEFQVATAADAVHEVRVLEGDLSFSAHSRSPRYGWTTAIAISQSAMIRQAYGPVVAAAFSGFAVATLVVGAVMLFSARLMRGIRVLADATVALGDGRDIALPRFRIREVAQVGTGMQRAAAKIAEGRRQLQVRIAEATQELRRETEERLKAEAALAHAQRLEALGQLTSGVAHDVNNLLTVISLNLEMIERSATTEDMRRFVHRALQGTERGARLVESLLAFARKQPLHPKFVNPNTLITEFAPIIKGAAGDGVHIDFGLDPALHSCRIDPAQFHSALLNLVTNSCAAMPTGGRITIETTNADLDPGAGAISDAEPGRFARISVSDTGTGMPPAVAARAFEPFFSTKEVGKGSGLGLAQIYGFAKQSGGEVRITSELGVGTTVHLYLPLAAENEVSEPAGGPAQEREPTAPQAAVMIVDDDLEVRAALVEGVRALGYSVTEASDGHSAFDRIAGGEHVDLVLTDYLMPNGMTGRGLSQRIAALDRDIKLLLISGNAAAIDQECDVRLLHKPFLMEELGRVIAQILQR